MAAPHIPNGFKPLIQGYSIGSPDGVEQTAVGGGIPRSAMLWDRGAQAFQVTMIMPPEQFAVWTAWFMHIIKKGAYYFVMPLDSGFGLQDHTCLMVPGSYSAVRAGKHTSVSFVVQAESRAYDMTAEEAAGLVEVWNEVGAGMDALFARLDQFANKDTLVLQGL